MFWDSGQDSVRCRLLIKPALDDDQPAPQGKHYTVLLFTVSGHIRANRHEVLLVDYHAI